MAKAARYILEPADARGRLEQLPRRPRRAERLRQGLLRPEAGRARSRRSLHAPGPRGHPGAGRRRRCNSFTKFYLALLGQFPYANCPAVPPEMMLLPSWAYFNIYAMSSWTRTIVVPLSIFYAHKPVRQSCRPKLGIRRAVPASRQTRRSGRTRRRAAGSPGPTSSSGCQVIKWVDPIPGMDLRAGMGTRLIACALPFALLRGLALSRAKAGCCSILPTATASAPSSRR